jgi:hypothetical protein
MNALTQILNRKDQDRNGFFCPACTSHGLDAEDMDLHNFWHHSQAMRDRYKAACCKDCTDRHLVTEDGVCMPLDKAQYSTLLDLWFSSPDAMYDAEYESAKQYDEDRDLERMCSGWR